MEICQFQKSDKNDILVSYRSFVTASFRWYPLWLWGQWHRPFFTRRPCRLSATGHDESVLLRYLKRLNFLLNKNSWGKSNWMISFAITSFCPCWIRTRALDRSLNLVFWPPKLEVFPEFLGLGPLLLKHTWSPRSTASMMRKIWETSSGKKTIGTWHLWLFLAHGKKAMM